MKPKNEVLEVEDSTGKDDSGAEDTSFQSKVEGMKKLGAIISRKVNR